MTAADSEVSRAAIARTETLIRPYIRRTPVLAVDLADFGLGDRPVDLKLEFLQHSGSFKARGAFANLIISARATGQGGEPAGAVLEPCQGRSASPQDGSPTRELGRHPMGGWWRISIREIKCVYDSGRFRSWP